MTEALQEYVDCRGVTLRVDGPAGVLRGVKLIGLESTNGRHYRPAALAAAVSMYEGAKVNVNHPKEGPLAPRDYRDRLGVIRQVEFRPDEGLFGNLHFNPKHAIAEQLAWDAQNNPRNVGFSHNVLARLTRDGDRQIVEAITHVQSVDLVADPAATQGLFEHGQAAAAAGGEAAPASVDMSRALARLTEAELRAARPELADQIAAAAAEQLRGQLCEAADSADRARRRLRVVELLWGRGLLESPRSTSGDSLPSVREAAGPAFFDALLAAADDQCVQSLVIERAEALQRARGAGQTRREAARPLSREQRTTLAEGASTPATAADFARSLLDASG